MKRISLIILLLFALFTSCSNQTPENAVSHGGMIDAALSFDLIMPSDAKRTESGLAYAIIEKGNGIKPQMTQALRVQLRAYDVMTGIVEEATVVNTIPQIPYFGEILTKMQLGDTFRVWGESEGRVWDITMIEVAHEFDPPEDRTPPKDAEEINGALWTLLEPGEGAKLTHGQAVRIHATRWNAKTGAVLESTIAGEGMLAILTNDMFYHDPVHAALLLSLSPKAKARVWLRLPKPGTPEEAETTGNEEFDILEDITIAARMPEYDVPPDLTAPDDATVIANGAWMKIITPASSEQPEIKDGDDILVDMTCWNADNGNLIMSSKLNKDPTRMVISEELGVWHAFMVQAKRGMTFRTWTTAEAMPDNVGMPMTCRVTIPEADTNP